MKSEEIQLNSPDLLRYNNDKLRVLAAFQSFYLTGYNTPSIPASKKWVW